MLPAIAAQGAGLQLLAAAGGPSLMHLSKVLAGRSMRSFGAETAAATPAAAAAAGAATEREDPASRVTKHLKVSTSLRLQQHGIMLIRTKVSATCCLAREVLHADQV
jgi:hypothetical protein